MTVLSAILPKDFDKEKLDTLLEKHKTNKNAIINLFLSKIVDGKINLDEFLDSGKCNESDSKILNERIEILEETVADIKGVVVRHCVLEDKLIDKINLLGDFSEKLETLRQYTIENGKFESYSRSLIGENHERIEVTKQEIETKINNLTNRLTTLELTFKQFLNAFKTYGQN